MFSVLNQTFKDFYLSDDVAMPTPNKKRLHHRQKKWRNDPGPETLHSDDS